MRSSVFPNKWRRPRNTRIRISSVDGVPTISVMLAVEIDSRVEVVRCLANEIENNEDPVVLWTYDP